MRSFFVLVVSLSLVILPCLGCGGDSKPEPVPGAVDSADPANLDAGGGLSENPNADAVGGSEPAAE